MSTKFGFKVSKAGYPVETADIQNLVFSSEYKTLTLAAVVSGQVTVQNNSPTWTQVIAQIAHNLGYIPAFVVYSQYGSGMRSVHGLGPNGEYANMPFEFPSGGDASIIPWADPTNINIKYGGQQGSAGVPETINYKVYIYYQKGA